MYVQCTAHMSETRNGTLLFTQVTETRQNYGGGGVYSPALADGMVSWVPSGHPITIPFHSPHCAHLTLPSCTAVTVQLRACWAPYTHTHIHGPPPPPARSPNVLWGVANTWQKFPAKWGRKIPPLRKKTRPLGILGVFTPRLTSKVTTRSIQENVNM
jgi:hypothetical protein